MAISTDLKQLRQQVEKLQVEVDGRRRIGSRVVWDQQNESSVNTKTSRMQEEFSGLVVHLTQEKNCPSQPSGITQTEFERLKEQIRGELDQRDSQALD